MRLFFFQRVFPVLQTSEKSFLPDSLLPFSSGKSPLPSPGPPSLPQKPLTGRTGSWRESRGKKDWMTRQAEMEKMWPFRLQAAFPSNRACRPSYGAPHTAPGTNMGHGGAGAAQTPPPCSLAALAPARMPGNGRHPTAIPQSASGSIPRQRPSQNAKGAGPPEEDRPLCKIGLSTGSRRFHQLPAA